MSTTADKAKVTKEDLQKALNELAGKPADVVTVADKKPELEMVSLTKSVDDALSGGPDGLRKALEASEVLSEFAGVIGLHVDEALDTLTKSINDGLKRDATLVEVLGEMKKSLDALAEKVEKFGEGPVIPKGAKSGDVVTSRLDKSLGERKITKQAISAGLVKLVKGLQGKDPQEADRLTRVAIRYESANQIGDEDLQKAIDAEFSPITK